MNEQVSLSQLDEDLRNTATGRSISFFEKGGSTDEVGSKFRPTTEALYTWSNLQKKLFMDRGISGFQLATIEEKEREVIEQASVMDLNEGEIPFVWVPSSYLVSVPTLMTMIIGRDRIVIYAGPVGYTRLDPRKLLSCADTPNSHSLWYAIFKVKNESDVGQNRSFLTVQEAMAVCVCTAILTREPVVAGNSCYELPSGKTVPVLEMSKQGPELLHKPIDDESQSSKWLTCQGRL